MTIDYKTDVQPSLPKPVTTSVLLGVASGLGAALCWALGFVATRHGLKAGFAPDDLIVHRFLWPGLAFLPFVLRGGVTKLCGVGWSRGLALAIVGGPVVSMIGYTGFLYVPLGHGSVIQPSCATLGGLLFAAVLLKERIYLSRLIGAVVIVGGLMVIGSESIGHIGTSGVTGDLLFVFTGLMFAGFGTLLGYWRLSAMPVAAALNVLSLLLLPLYLLYGDLDRLLRIGLKENAIQAVGQGVLAGPLAMFLFAFSVHRLGAARAAVIPAIVPALTLMAGWILLGEIPTILQSVGLVGVLTGYYLAQKSQGTAA